MHACLCAVNVCYRDLANAILDFGEAVSVRMSSLHLMLELKSPGEAVIKRRCRACWKPEHELEPDEIKLSPISILLPLTLVIKEFCGSWGSSSWNAAHIPGPGVREPEGGSRGRWSTCRPSSCFIAVSWLSWSATKCVRVTPWLELPLISFPKNLPCGPPWWEKHKGILGNVVQPIQGDT